TSMIIAELAAILGLKIDKKSFSEADKLLGKVKTGLLSLVAFEAIEKGIHKLAEAVESTIAFGSSLENLSKSAGVPVEALQKLGNSAKRHGSSIEELGLGFKFLSRNMVEAATGGKEQAEIFAALG